MYPLPLNATQASGTEVMVSLDLPNHKNAVKLTTCIIYDSVTGDPWTNLDPWQLDYRGRTSYSISFPRQDLETVFQNYVDVFTASLAVSELEDTITASRTVRSWHRRAQ